MQAYAEAHARRFGTSSGNGAAASNSSSGGGNATGNDSNSNSSSSNSNNNLVHLTVVHLYKLAESKLVVSM
jgi:hypothetical protein